MTGEIGKGLNGSLRRDKAGDVLGCQPFAGFPDTGLTHPACQHGFPLPSFGGLNDRVGRGQWVAHGQRREQGENAVNIRVINARLDDLTITFC